MAFLIYRPVMRLFKSPGGEGVCWPLDAGEEVDSEKGLLDFVLHLDSSQGPVRYIFCWKFFILNLETRNLYLITDTFGNLPPMYLFQKKKKKN